jgi:hypothetical protein
VSKGESIGGKNSFIFLTGESTFSDILNKINKIKHLYELLLQTSRKVWLGPICEFRKVITKSINNYYVPGPGVSLGSFIGEWAVPWKLFTKLDGIFELK